MKYLFIVICFIMTFSLYSQSVTDSYIDQYSDLAIKEMKKYGIPASIILAQGILESANGTSQLATEGNNHFGIKCHGWKGMKIYFDDDEKNECFRKYNNPKKSYRDHSEFLITRSRYSKLFNLELTDYKGWSEGLQDAGYATSSDYSDNLIKLIDQFSLNRFDLEYEKRKERTFFVSHSYGFPFLYSVGLNYFNEDRCIISADLSSSFIYSGASIGGEVFLFNRFYGGIFYTIAYHGYDDLEIHKIDFLLSPELTYVSEISNKKIFINLGCMIPIDPINGNRFIPKFTVTYLLDQS